MVAILSALLTLAVLLPTGLSWSSLDRPTCLCGMTRGSCSCKPASTRTTAHCGASSGASCSLRSPLPGTTGTSSSKELGIRERPGIREHRFFLPEPERAGILREPARRLASLFSRSPELPPPRDIVSVT